MTIGVSDVVRCIATFNMPESTISQLVYHFIGNTGTTATDAEMVTAALAHFQAAWTNIDNRVSDQVQGDILEVQKYDFVLHQWDGIGQATFTAADGLSTADMLAHGTCGLVKILTVAARRQCRKYVPGLTETELTDGLFSTATVVDLALFGSALDQNLIAGGLTSLFCSFNTDSTSVLYETASTRLGAVTATNLPAYQRRRRPGTGI